MSGLFGFGRPQPSSAEKIAAAETEMEMVADLFNRLSRSCIRKCVPRDYHEADLNKAESVCLDRCVSKFFDVNVKISEKMQGDAQRAGAAPGGGGMFGM